MSTLQFLYFAFLLITSLAFFSICEKVLDKPRFNYSIQYLFAILNAAFFTYLGFNNLPMFVFAAIFIILTLELVLLFQNSFLGIVIYPLMATIYLMCVQSIVMSAYSLLFKVSFIDVVTNYGLLCKLIVFSWFICCTACVCVRLFTPLHFLRVINQNKEQVRFKFLFLLLASIYMILNSFIYASVENFNTNYLLIHQIITPLIWIMVISLTSALLVHLDFLYGYKIKTLELEETVAKQQDELIINKRKAERDSLVEVYNKASSRAKIEEALLQSKTGAFFIIDIDNFKTINDTKGHPFGDKVLIYITKRMLNTFRENDVIGRIGGDEFIIFLDSESSLKVVESKARELCRDINVPFSDGQGETVNITISIGIALTPNHGIDFDTLYKHADTALYQSKRNGKNTFSIYGIL